MGAENAHIISMIIFLYGPDDYRREQKKREIVAEFLKKHAEAGLAYFDAAIKNESEDLAEFLRIQSIFETKKLAVLEGIFPKRRGSSDDDGAFEGGGAEKDEAQKEGIVAIVKQYLSVPNITILISENKKPAKAFGFLAKPPAMTQEFPVLTGSAWTAFIKSEAKKYDVSFAPSALSFFAGVFAGDSWAAATELQKLAGFGRAVGVEDLDALDLEAAPNYWALLNGVKSYDIRTRLAALETLLGMSDPAPKLFNILASQWKERLSQFAAYDTAIKSGKLEYEEALVDVVIG